MKKSTSTYTAYIDRNSVYQRCNTSQINKVRLFIRKQKYLLNPKIENQRVSIDGKKTISDELISFDSIAVNNISEYIEAKINKTAVTTTPVYITNEEHEEINSIENRKIGDLKIMLFKTIDTVNKDDASIQQEIYNKSVKGKKKKNVLNIFIAFVNLQKLRIQGNLIAIIMNCNTFLND